MDSTYFTAYNTCDLKTQAEIIAEDVEFYHDQGGLSTSKKELLESIEKNICGKVTRELIEGSLEVHEIKGYGAVAMGLHKFHNNQEPDAISKPSKF
ncbi:MAG: nuclear transport factor 2 family protein, partial [Maribacter sp.]|nr:nuclear transport factor 2 family protein [Maribacter sp.]